ncbi:hypothetical protein TPELBph1_CDS0032 [Terrisporobacter phage TPELB_ph1]
MTPPCLNIIYRLFFLIRTLYRTTVLLSTYFFKLFPFYFLDYFIIKSYN